MDNQNNSNNDAVSDAPVDSVSTPGLTTAEPAPLPAVSMINSTAQKPHKNRWLVFLIIATIVFGIVGMLLWRISTTKNTESIDANNSSVTKSVVSPDMNFAAPQGWAEQTVNTSRYTVITYTSPDDSGAKIVLIMQEGASRSEKDKLVATSDIKEVELKSALFGDQYKTKYDNATNIVTSFQLRVHFDVLIEEAFYSQPKYQQVYQTFLDSFVPNGTTNNQ